MELRLAKSEELDVIWEIYTGSIRAMQKAGIDQWDEIYPTPKEIRSDIEGESMYVLRDGSQIISAVTINTDSDPKFNHGNWQHNVPYYVVHRLCVHPEKQGKGVATATMRLVEEKAKELGAGALRLDAFADNRAALRLYRALGYRHVGDAQRRKGLFLLFEKRFG